MKNFMRFFILTLLVMVISGCYSTGLSVREKGGYNYSNFIYSMNNGDGFKRSRFIIEGTINVGVAQVGELTPSLTMIDDLKLQKFVNRVEPLPVPGIEGYNISHEKMTDLVQKGMSQVIDLAQAMGLDYVFIYGGSADVGEQGSFLNILDWTIIGAYLVPSNTVVVDATATGALIDVNDRSIALMVSADLNQKKNYPTMLMYSRKDKMMAELRDELIKKLTGKLITKLEIYS